MPLTTKTLEEAEQLAAAVLRNLAAANGVGIDISEGSDYWATVKLLARLYHGNQGQAAYFESAIFGHKSTGDPLLEHMRSRGLTPRDATYATGTAILTNSASGQTQPAGSILTAVDGTEYETLADTTSALAGWSGKTVGEVLSTTRIMVKPNASSMAVGDFLGISTTPSQGRAIKATGPSDNGDPPSSNNVFIDIYPPLDTIPSAGTQVSAGYGCTVPIRCKTAGRGGNKAHPEQLTLQSPVGNFSATAFIGELSGGADAMTEGGMQAAVFAYGASRPLVGNPQWFREQALKTPGVGLADAVVFPNLLGIGTQVIYLIGATEGYRPVALEQVNAVQAYVDSVAPSPEQGTVVVRSIEVRTYPNTTDVNVTIVPEAGYEPDFTDPGLGTPTGSTNPVTGYIAFTPSGWSDLRTIIEVGDRICLTGVYIRPEWVQLEITQVGVDFVRTAPFNSYTNMLAATPGGPLAQAAHDAIFDLFDGLGPSSRSVTGFVRRHPDPSTLWHNGVPVVDLIRALKSVPGVSNLTLTAPAADVVPTLGLTAGLGRVVINHG